MNETPLGHFSQGRFFAAILAKAKKSLVQVDFNPCLRLDKELSGVYNQKMENILKRYTFKEQE